MRVQRPTTVRNDPMPPNPYVRLIAAARYCCLDDPRDGGVGVEGVDVEALSRGPKSMRAVRELLSKLAHQRCVSSPGSWKLYRRHMMRGWSAESAAAAPHGDYSPLQARHWSPRPCITLRTASSSKSPVYPADRPTRKLPRNGRTLLTRWLLAHNLSTSCTAVAGTAPLLSLPCYTPD